MLNIRGARAPGGPSRQPWKAGCVHARNPRRPRRRSERPRARRWRPRCHPRPPSAATAADLAAAGTGAGRPPLPVRPTCSITRCHPLPHRPPGRRRRMRSPRFFLPRRRPDRRCWRLPCRRWRQSPSLRPSRPARPRSCTTRVSSTPRTQPRRPQGSAGASASHARAPSNQACGDLGQSWLVVLARGVASCRKISAAIAAAPGPAPFRHKSRRFDAVTPDTILARRADPVICSLRRARHLRRRRLHAGGAPGNGSGGTGGHAASGGRGGDAGSGGSAGSAGCRRRRDRRGERQGRRRRRRRRRDDRSRRDRRRRQRCAGAGGSAMGGTGGSGGSGGAVDGGPPDSGPGGSGGSGPGGRGGASGGGGGGGGGAGRGGTAGTMARTIEWRPRSWTGSRSSSRA